MSDFTCGTLHVRSEMPGLKCRIWNAGFEMSDFKRIMSDFKCQMLKVSDSKSYLKWWIWYVGFEMSDFTCQIWNARSEMSDLKCRTLEVSDFRNIGLSAGFKKNRPFGMCRILNVSDSKRKCRILNVRL